MAQAKAKEAEVQSKENEVDEVQSTMYKNAYHRDLDKEVEDPRQAVEDTQEATPQETGFISKDETQPNHDYKKRYDDLKSHYDRKQNENTQKLQEMEAKLKIAEKNKAMANYVPPKTDDELSEFKKKYPDVYDVVETISQKQASKQVEYLQEEVKSLRKREEDLIVQSAYRELLTAHSDFNELKDAPEFLDWLQTQPPSIADGVTKNNTDSKWAIRVIDLYKADAGISKSKTKSKSAADAVTRTSSKNVNVENKDGKKVWKSSEILKLKPWEYAKVEQEIDTALREGRVVRDTK